MDFFPKAKAEVADEGDEEEWDGQLVVVGRVHLQEQVDQQSH